MGLSSSHCLSLSLKREKERREEERSILWEYEQILIIELQALDL